MSFIFLFPSSPWIWLALLFVLVLLLGSRKLPQLARAIGQSKRAFKSGVGDVGHQKDGEGRTSLQDVNDQELFEEATRREKAKRVS